MLRIQTGKYKGRLIAGAPTGVYVRPILARIKKSLFDILSPHITNSIFLDLYAGTGSVGIEALSRGAAYVTFVENNRRCIEVIKDNLQKLNNNDYEILSFDVLNGLKFREKEYDIIFMGPPYKTAEKRMLALTSPTIAVIAKEKLLAEKGVIVAQHHAKEPITDVVGITLYRREKYGDNYLSFYRSEVPAQC